MKRPLLSVLFLHHLTLYCSDIFKLGCVNVGPANHLVITHHFTFFCSRGGEKVERLHFSCPHRCSMGLRAQRKFLFLPGCACHSRSRPSTSPPGSRALTLTRGVFADVNCKQMCRGINYRAPSPPAPPQNPFPRVTEPHISCNYATSLPRRRVCQLLVGKLVQLERASRCSRPGQDR